MYVAARSRLPVAVVKGGHPDTRWPAQAVLVVSPSTCSNVDVDVRPDAENDRHWLWPIVEVVCVTSMSYRRQRPRAATAVAQPTAGATADNLTRGRPSRSVVLRRPLSSSRHVVSVRLCLRNVCKECYVNVVNLLVVYLLVVDRWVRGGR